MLANWNLLDASPKSQVRKLDEVLKDWDEIPRIKEQMAQLKQQVECLSLATQYSTRSEHDVGSSILNDTKKGILKHLEFPIQVTQCSLELECSLLSVSSHKKHEDQVINEPMMNLMQ